MVSLLAVRNEKVGTETCELDYRCCKQEEQEE